MNRWFARTHYHGKVSFSQSGEDMIIRHIFGSLKITKPSYLEIGAYDPYKFSNTAHFYLNGSRGITVEPDPVLFANIARARPRDINLNAGVAAKKGEASIYLLNPSTLNTFSQQHATELVDQRLATLRETRMVPLLPIHDILAAHWNHSFPDFLSLDAEGLDEEILDSIDFTAAAPTIICVETISYSVTGRGVKNAALIEQIARAGYLNYADTFINTIFVKRSAWLR